jgi:hypothetical protein
VIPVYAAYGLTFTSSVAIPALVALQQAVYRTDAHVDVGLPPPWVSNAQTLPPRRIPTVRDLATKKESVFSLTEYGDGLFFLLAYGDGTRFMVDGAGTRIWGEPGSGLTNDDVFVYLLGPILGFVLRRRGHVPLHASALDIQGRAVALVGPPGSGKSTTAAALALRGWPVLCEDVCALQRAESKWNVLPGYSRICLWPDSVEFLFPSLESLPLIIPQGWSKRYLPLDGSRARFAERPSDLSTIFMLDPRSAEPSTPRIERLSPASGLVYLVQHTYMNWLIDRSQRALEFETLAHLASQVRIFRITPSSRPDRLADLLSLIESHAGSSDSSASQPISMQTCIGWSNV